MAAVDTAVLAMRDELWAAHPVITETAIVPTDTILRAYAIVSRAARRHRDSVAFWANPGTGKSSCIDAMKQLLCTQFEHCAVVVYEAKTRVVVAEGAFIEDMLIELGYTAKIQSSLSGKRKQLERFLYALAATGGRLVIFIDEAQELHSHELCWLKCMINWLTRRMSFITVVLFGQHELIDKKNEILTFGRSDLNLRFTNSLYEFEAVLNRSELAHVLANYDGNSEFPNGSHISYTKFLWPRAYANGFRLQGAADWIWQAFSSMSLSTHLANGISMFWVARALSEIAISTKDLDAPALRLAESDWCSALGRLQYTDVAPVLVRGRRHDRAPSRG